ncbi:MAG: hypothetical protein ACWA5R_02575 [bacterium]
MSEQELTVDLPKTDVEFIHRFAAEHDLTVDDVLQHYVEQLREQAKDKAVYYEHLGKKYQ